jgi:hypothetical protein
MGHTGSESQPTDQISGDGDSAQRPSGRRATIQFMGPQAETLDRLLGRTEAELGAAQTRRGWSLFSILRAAYQALSSDPNR